VVLPVRWMLSNVISTIQITKYVVFVLKNAVSLQKNIPLQEGSIVAVKISALMK